MKIKPISEIVDKWARRASAAGQDYANGIRAPRRPWQEATLAAVSAFEQGIADAIANGLFAKGVRNSSNAEWQNRALTLGVQRYPNGVRESEPKYSKGFAPYHAALSGLELPPRGPRGSSENYDRVRQIGETLHALRISHG